MDKELLQTKKTFLEERQTTSKSVVTSKEKDLETAKNELTQAYEKLNQEKTTLNSKSTDLSSKYTQLITKDTELKQALITKMKHDLDENTRKLNLEFYNAQKTAYNNEKDAIVAKIKAINPSFSQTDICNPTPPTSIFTKSTPPTAEETAIEKEINSEIQTVCGGLKTNTTNISSNTSELTDSSDYTNKKTERDNLVNEIRSKTSEYNLQIIQIKSAESVVQMKLLQLQHKEQAYLDAKLNNEKIKNEIEVLSEEIQNIH